MTARIIEGDALARLAELPGESVHCVVTSPPYYGLRDYGVAGQLGLEATPDEYIARMVAVFREVRRVLRRDGTAWVNMGDGYAGGGHGGGGSFESERNWRGGGSFESERNWRAGGKINGGAAKPKNLLGMPWMLAFALRADGWWLRQDIIWAKPNPMPESVTDRCTKAHEYLFLLSKGERYFYDAEAIAEGAVKEGQILHSYGTGAKDRTDITETNDRRTRIGLANWNKPVPSTRNRRSVWTIATEAFPEAHFATYPTALVEPCILAGTSQKGVCPNCGAPWRRVVETGYANPGNRTTNGARSLAQRHETAGFPVRLEKRSETTGWSPLCRCDAGDLVPATVLDPFLGAGTTALVADRLGRNSIGIELNPAYAEMARRRIADDAGMFARLYDPEADAIASYNEAVREVGKRVKAGAPIPDFFLSDRAAK